MRPKVINTIDTRSEAKKQIDAMRADLEVMLEYARIISKISKEQYEALLEEGFSEEQAMRIITTQPSWKV